MYRGPKELEKIQAVFPQADLKFLDTGHLVQVEAPNEFIDMTVDFINAKWFIPEKLAMQWFHSLTQVTYFGYQLPLVAYIQLSS